MNKALSFTLTAVLVGLVAFTGESQGGVTPAGAIVAPHRAEPIRCPAGDDPRAALSGLRADIARARTVEEARALALAPMDAALDAVGKSRIVAPLSQDLIQAQSRLAEARSRIEGADTPAQVADQFSGMMLAGLDDDRLARIQVGSHGCNYSTGETIAIIVGLILGIIPGLILLAVLC